MVNNIRISKGIERGFAFRSLANQGLEVASRNSQARNNVMEGGDAAAINNGNGGGEGGGIVAPVNVNIVGVVAALNDLPLIEENAIQLPQPAIGNANAAAEFNNINL